MAGGLDEQLEEWLHFCEGTQEFEEYYFSTLLHDVFYEFGKPQRTYLKGVCSPFDNANEIYRFLKCLGEGGQELTERQTKGRMLKFTKADVGQRLSLLDPRRKRQMKLKQLIESLPLTFCSSEVLSEAREYSQVHEDFTSYAEDQLADLLALDPVQFELSEAVYNAFSDLKLQEIFNSYLADDAEPLVAAFELWLLNGDYLITEEEILVSPAVEEDVDGLVWPGDFD